MPSAPTVSVIIPVYNRSQAVVRAISSVRAQTFQDFELIVVDDGSTESLAAAVSSVKDSRLRLVAHKRNRGPAAARNTGVAKAKGRFVAFLDSDDEWLPEKLERQLRFMRDSNPLRRASCTAYEILTPYAPEGERRIGAPLVRHRDLLHGCRISPGSTLVAERDVFDQIGPMNEALRRLEDWDWLLRYTAIENLAVMLEVLSRIDYRQSAGVNYAHVEDAVAIMKRKHVLGRSPLSRLSRLRFLGTLENELAAVAYKNGLYGRALLQLTKSLCFFPYRSSDTIKRLATALLADVSRRNRRSDSSG